MTLLEIIGFDLCGVMLMSLTWLWFEDRNAAIREATIRARRDAPVMLAPKLPMARVAIPAAYRRAKR